MDILKEFDQLFLLFDINISDYFVYVLGANRFEAVGLVVIA